MSKIINIATGWFNKMRDSLGSLPNEIKIKSEIRLRTCSTCPQRDKDKCKICGCPLKQKSMSDSKCPLNKWI